MTSSDRRRVHRLKRAMLRAAVADNVATIRGLRPSGLNRHPRNWWLRWAPLAAVALSVAAGALAPASGRDKARTVAARSPGPGAAPGAGYAALSTDVRALDPATLRLSVGRVVVDPGHGGDDPGAVASGLREKDLTLEIARRVRVALKADGFEVVMTRDGDQRVPLRQRAQAANGAGGDLFLSIHVNSIPMPDRRGVETYVLGTTSDPRLAELSGAENSVSGYSLHDFRAILEGVFRDARHEASRRFGQAVQASMCIALRASNRDLEDRGVKQAPFVVLVGTEMPAVLAEVSCLSSPEDVVLLRDSGYKQQIADALAAGVRNYAATCNHTADRPRPARGGE